MHFQSLKLYTSNLSAQTLFYAEVLGLPISSQTANTIAFDVGVSILQFEYRAEAKPYHFAINIPSNQIQAACDWLKTRVPILTDGENEIQHFDFWSAAAVYFYDADKNIVEFIARRTMQVHSAAYFSPQSLLEISEIGLPTSDIEQEYNILHKATGIAVFSGGFERFCAIGEEHGLFICIQKEGRKWFPVNDTAYSSDFEVLGELDGCNYLVRYAAEVLEVFKREESSS